MAIRRAPRPESHFYVLDKRISEDQRLSWAARGLLIFLLGKPDDWSVSVQHLSNQTNLSRKPTKRDGVYALLSEIEAAGYLRREQAKEAGGTFGGIDYIVQETPHPDKPDTAETTAPHTDKPDTADPTLTSIESLPRKDSSSPRARGGKKPATADYLPDDWQITDDLKAKLTAKGFSEAKIDAEATKFRIYWHERKQRGDTKAKKKSWSLAFMNWMDKAAKDQEGTGPEGPWKGSRKPNRGNYVRGSEQPARRNTGAGLIGQIAAGLDADEGGEAGGEDTSGVTIEQ